MSKVSCAVWPISFRTENPSLKKYLLSESDDLLEECFRAAAEHETVMTQSFGHPHAFAIYLEMVEKFQLILDHFEKHYHDYGQKV